MVDFGAKPKLRHRSFEIIHESDSSSAGVVQLKEAKEGRKEGGMF